MTEFRSTPFDFVIYEDSRDNASVAALKTKIERDQGRIVKDILEGNSCKREACTGKDTHWHYWGKTA
jgi:hypothetical protein